MSSPAPEAAEPRRAAHKLAVVGGGVAGVSVCLQLFARLKERELLKPLEVDLFEKSDRIGPGVAYRTTEPTCLMHLPKGLCEPVAGSKGAFTRWLDTDEGCALDNQPKSNFPPRHSFGRYMELLAERLLAEAEEHGTIQLRFHKATEIDTIEKRKGGGYLLSATGSAWEADQVVLCTGPSPPEQYHELTKHANFHHSPATGTFDLSPVDAHADVGIIGARLTAVDLALALRRLEHRGRVVMGSRSGLLPALTAESFIAQKLGETVQPVELKHLALEGLPAPLRADDVVERFFLEVSDLQGSPVTLESFERSLEGTTPLEWLDRQIASNSASCVKPWQQVLFTVCPLMTELWSRVDNGEKRRFMDKYATHLTMHLASIPLENALRIREMIVEGRLLILRQLQRVEHSEGTFTMRGVDASTNLPATHRLAHVFNASGLGYTLSDIPLYRNMLSQGIAQQHPLGGIDIEPKSMRVLDPSASSEDQRLHDIFALSNRMNGHFPLASSVTKLAVEADAIAKQIAGGLVAGEQEERVPSAFVHVC